MTRRRLQRAAMIAACIAGAAMLVPAGPVRACAYDGAVPDLKAAHPRSIAVALAVREALDREQLRALPELPPALGFIRARQLLMKFEFQVAAVAGERTGTVAVLLVESGLWTRYRLGRGGVGTEPHVAGPLQGEQVIVTSEAALGALVEGTLTPEGAAALGVLRIDTPGSV